MVQDSHKIIRLPKNSRRKMQNTTQKAYSAKYAMHSPGHFEAFEASPILKIDAKSSPKHYIFQVAVL